MRFFSNGVYYYGKIHQNRSGYPWLLMLHGFMGTGRVFGDLLPLLKNICNPLTIDLLGHGQTVCAADSARFSADRQSADICSIIERLSPENLYIYGYSMGGRLALQIAASRYVRPEGVIIESSHCGIRSETEREERIRTDEERAKQIEENYSLFLEKWLTKPLFGSEKSTAHRYAGIMKTQVPECMAASLRGFGAGIMPSVCGELRDLKPPLFMIAGAKDQKYVRRMQEMEKSVKNSKLYVVEEAGHRVHADRPAAVATLLKQWI